MCLLQTLKNVMHTLEYVKSKSVVVRFHGRGKNEASHYCGQCEVLKYYSEKYICTVNILLIALELLRICLLSSLKTDLSSTII